MPQIVTLQLPDEMLQRCQRGATAAGSGRLHAHYR